MTQLNVTMSDGSVWSIPSDIIAKDRAEYYAKVDSERNGERFEEVYKRELEYTLSSPDEIIDWASGNMNWDDVAEHATQSRQAQPGDYHADWVNAQKSVVAE